MARADNGGVSKDYSGVGKHGEMAIAASRRAAGPFVKGRTMRFSLI